MKRKSNPVPEGLTRWIKIGGGSFHARIGGRMRIIKPNEIFDARLEDIPPGFRDVVLPYEGNTVSEEKKASESAPKLEYFAKVRSPGYYDVVDKNGKVQNQKALRKAAADTLIESLQ